MMGHITSTQAGISADLRTVGTMADVLNSTGKDTEDSATLQLSLFDSPEVIAARDMEFFLATIRPHLEGLKPGDRLSVLSCLYWIKAGEDKETIIPLLRGPLRATFEGILATITF